MKTAMIFTLCVLPVTLFLVGCNQEHSHAANTQPASQPVATGKADADDPIKANLAKLSPEDRKLAEVQKFCAVENESPLGGAMGVPVKIMINDQPVFLCCAGCKKDAMKDPDKTLAKVEELKAKNKAGDAPK
jgi:hypothetical protein